MNSGDIGEHAPWLLWGPTSSLLPASCHLPGMGSSPPCGRRRSDCVPGKGPRFAAGLRGQGHRLDPKGAGQALAHVSWEGWGWGSSACLASPLIILGDTQQGSSPPASRYQLCPGAKASILEVTHCPWVAGLGCGKGTLLFWIPPGALHFHFVLDPTNHAAGSAHW